jgi:hypothetical protein
MNEHELKALRAEIKALREEVISLRKHLSVTAVVLHDQIDRQGTTTLWDLDLRHYQNGRYITQAQAEKAMNF